MKLKLTQYKSLINTNSKRSGDTKITHFFAAGYYVPLCQKPLQSPGKQRPPVCPHPKPLTIDGVTELTE